MKREELKKCALCRRGVMHAGVPLFYRVTVQAFGVDARAVRQIAGLEQFFGNVALANVFAPDDDIAKPIGEPVPSIVCQTCSTEPQPLMLLVSEKK